MKKYFNYFKPKMLNLGKNSLLLCFLGLMAQVQKISAQDSHYWNLQVGTRGMLVGGTLTSGVYDNSATYYNPAGLAMVRASHLTINASAYRAEIMSIKDGAGTAQNILSRRITNYPQMMSSMLTHNENSRLKLAAVMLTRQSANWDVSNYEHSLVDILPQRAGQEEYLAALTYQNSVTEPWFGLGGGYTINEHWTAGFSSFIAYRNQRYLFDISARATSTDLNQSPFMAIYQEHNDLRINTLKNINKFGLHGHWDKIRFGVCATMPSINILGWSRVGREVVFQNLENEPDGVWFDQQRMVDATYKTPLSLAVGISFDLPKTRLNFNSEYFAPIAAYKMVNAASRNVAFPTTLSGYNNDFLDYYTYANQVLNFGVSAEFELNPKWTAHTALRTDQSYHRRKAADITESQLIVLAPSVDLYHASGGFSLTRRASVMSFGLNYALGYSRRQTQFVNFSDPQYSQRLLGTPADNLQFSSHSFTLLVGYNYFFAMK
jgi:hypothetical protein